MEARVPRKAQLRLLLLAHSLPNVCIWPALCLSNWQFTAVCGANFTGTGQARAMSADWSCVRVCSARLGPGPEGTSVNLC